MTGSLQGAAPGRRGRLSRLSATGKAFALAILVALAAVSSARPQGFTVERFYEICHDRTSAQWREAGHYVCPSFVRGIIDGARLQALRDAGGSIPDHFRILMICDPPTATGEEALAIVVRFIESRPDTRPLPVAAIVFQALGAAWPCSN